MTPPPQKRKIFNGKSHNRKSIGKLWTRWEYVIQRDVLQVLGIRGSRSRDGDKEECNVARSEGGQGPEGTVASYVDRRNWEQEYLCSEGSHYYVLAFVRRFHIPAAHLLTLQGPGWYLNFSAWPMNDVLFGQDKIELWNKRHFVENKTHYAACPKNAVNFLVAHIYIHNYFRGAFVTYR